jgi:hypothetical protein
MLGTSLKISHYLLAKEHGDLNSKETTPNPWACCGAQRKKILLAKRGSEPVGWVFCWVPDGTTKYRRLTKDRGEAPERGKVGYLPTPPLDEELPIQKSKKNSYLDTVHV